MDEVDRWIYLDGPEPARLRPVLDALRFELEPTEEEQERLVRAVMGGIDALMVTGGPCANDDDDGEGAETPRIVRPAPRRPTSRPPAPMSAANEGGTQRSPTLDDHVATPPPAPPPAPRPPARAVAPPPPAPAARPLEPVIATAQEMELPPDIRALMAKLPFLRPEEVPPDKKSTRTVKVPVMRATLGETVPADSDAITRAVAAALPFAAVPAPPVEAFASFCAERAVYPDQAALTWQRYHVAGEAGERARYTHWRRVLGENPTLHAMFVEKLGEFTIWLQTYRAAHPFAPPPGPSDVSPPADAHPDPRAGC